MLQIPATYYKNNEDYITIPKIKDFMRSHSDGKFKFSLQREQLMDSILEYANKSETNAELVLNWLDDALQEGIKDINLQAFPLNETMKVVLSNVASANHYLKQQVDKNANPHICLNQYAEYYKLINSYAIDTEYGIKVVFIYCKKLHMHDKKNQRTKTIDYPVTAEYYVEGEWLLVKAKPRSNLYVYNPQGFNIEGAVTTTTEKEIKYVVEKVKNILNLEKSDKTAAAYFLKNKVFELIHKYTKTPVEIFEVMETQKSNIETIANNIQAICTVEGSCQIPSNMMCDVNDDIRNIVEKYLSVNWNDKSIFIKDRDAYPIKVSATDEEESKVEQSAALKEPLQTKAIFFDNKKMLYKNKRCNGVVFQWKRINTLKALNEFFPVRIIVDDKGNCIFKFPEYTTKEDIENVIFSIIKPARTTN